MGWYIYMQYRICMKDSWKNGKIDTETVIAPFQERGYRYKNCIGFIQKLYLGFSHAGLLHPHHEYEKTFPLLVENIFLKKFHEKNAIEGIFENQFPSLLHVRQKCPALCVKLPVDLDGDPKY